MNWDLLKESNWFERTALCFFFFYPIASVLNFPIIHGFSPELGWNKFLSDPGFWGNIIGAIATLWVIRFTISEGKRTRLLMYYGQNLSSFSDEIYAIDNILMHINFLAEKIESYKNSETHDQLTFISLKEILSLVSRLSFPDHLNPISKQFLTTLQESMIEFVETLDNANIIEEPNAPKNPELEQHKIGVLNSLLKALEICHRHLSDIRKLSMEKTEHILKICNS